MPLYELLIAVADEADLPSGHKRKKEGDIVAVRSYPWNWGRKEIDEYLIIIAEFDEDLSTLRKRFESCIYAGNLTQEDIDQTKYFVGEHYCTPPKLEKNRFKINLSQINNQIPFFDLNKAKDKKYLYQPFKKASQVVQKFTGLETGAVDTGPNKEQEYIISKTAIAPMIKDKIWQVADE